MMLKPPATVALGETSSKGILLFIQLHLETIRTQS